MRKIKLLFWVCCLLVTTIQAQKPHVVTTVSILADMTQNIGGEHVQTSSIVPVGGDPHIYEPKPSDAQLAAKADLILKNGLTFEGWLTELIENSGTKAKSVLVTAGLDPIASLTYENSADPHAWMDASYGLIYAQNIKDALIELDPEHTEAYQANFDLYAKEIAALHRYIQEQINQIPEQQRVLITSHDAFQYFGRRYGLQLESILGTSTDAEAQTTDVIRLTKVIKSSGVPAVFIESTVNPKMLQQIAKDTGVRIGGKLFSDSIGGPESEAPTYLDMLRYNTDTIVKALTSKKEDALDQASGEGTPWVWYGVIGVLFLGGFIVMARQMNT